MLTPLATLQTQGKLIKTRATKNKDGLLHSTTFEVNAKLCLLACAYSEKNYENLSLPFLCLHLNHSQTQDIEIMNYQRRASAGLIDKTAISETAQRLKCVLASLEPISVINPFAPLIELPESIPHPRKTLLLLLDFINVVTFFHQFQRERVVNEETGEIYIKTAPEDIKLAFSLLKTSLLRKADDLSTSGRGFLSWLKKYLQEAKTKQFTALDIRKAKTIHPRTLNRYLQELTLFHYLQITGGNKHRGGFIYKLTELNELTTLQNSIETSIKNTLEKINGKPSDKSEQVPQEIKTAESVVKSDTEPTFFEKNYKRIRINDKEEHTYKLILELEAKEPNREYLTSDITALSKRSQCIEARYLKTLWEQGKLNRVWKNRQYYYSLTTSSKTVSQNPLSNS
jgi:DNA-binding HxlR family transcriptional regulator